MQSQWMSALPMADIHLSGHGILDLSSYETFFAGELHTCDYPAGVIAEATRYLPEV